MLHSGLNTGRPGTCVLPGPARNAASRAHRILAGGASILGQAALALVLLVALAASAETHSADSHSRPAPPAFSVQRGHFEQAFELEIRAPTPGLSIIYTTDGSQPAADTGSGTRVPADSDDEPAAVRIRIDATMSVRAATVSGGHLSKIATHSYVFPHQVLVQRGPKGSTPRWGHSGPDWEMDPQVVKHRDPLSKLVANDLMAVPALYISLPFADFWGPGGIYLEGEGEARDCSVEFLNPAADPEMPNRVPGFHKNATVEITGGSSTERWKTDKLSLRLRFHGGTKFPFLSQPGTSADGDPVDHFHTLILDARLNESWTHPSASQREAGQYTRDQYLADLQRLAGGLAPRGRHVHLYIAGYYWGLYNLHERPDHHFAAAYRGGKAHDWEIVKHNPRDVVNGDGSHYRALEEEIARPDIGTADAFEAVSELLDIEDFARYVLVNFWGGNTDWSHQNWYASYRSGDPSERWRFHSWDGEHILQALDEDVTIKDDAGSPTAFHRRLMMNPRYRAVFEAAVREAIAPGGLLDPQRLLSGYRTHMSEVDGAVRAESARWGDNRRHHPYTRGDDWRKEGERLLQAYLPRRTAVVLEQLGMPAEPPEAPGN